MKCIFCGCSESKVVDSRAVEEKNAIRRRRECLNCGKRFTTYENMEEQQILVIKRDGGMQPFNAEKIKKGVLKACEKRPVSLLQIDEICEKVKLYIDKHDLMEIEASKIGELVLESLKQIDKVSYVRYASVFLCFESLEDFKNLLD